ncbi:MAG: hypothetical protein JWO35_123 [Candidatus Saccharibacteria bacterium]|nr:hypothetical protein [Candidatus Saccharibacteria bacterium]
MPVTKINSIDIESIDTFKKLLFKLRSLDSQLINSDFSRVAPFNSAYIVVTAAIGEALDNGYFENPKFIENFTLCFSHYYFAAINEALAGSNDLPVAWAKLLTPKTGKRLPNFIYILMGANAHINHDLSLVMVKMLDNDDTENVLRDIIRVDKLLVNSGNDILSSFTEPKRSPRFIKDKFSYIYLPMIMQVILYWRVKAWRDYLSIKSNGLRADRSQIKGKAISNRLLWLGKSMSQ